MVWLAGLGFAALCLHIAIAPALAFAGWLAPSGGAAPRRLTLFAALCGLASLSIIVLNWPIFGVLLRMSPFEWLFAAIGTLTGARMLALAVRRRSAPRMASLRSEDAEAHPELADALEVAADAIELRHVPKLAVLDGVASPAVTGLTSPVLMFPRHLESLPQDRMQIVLAHELAHVKLGHLVWSHLVTGLAGLMWPNPIGRWAKESLVLLMESEADQAVADLNFSQAQIRETRREVMSYLRAPRVSLAFAPEEEPAPAAVPRRGGLRLALEAVALPVGLACAMLPQGILARPSVLGFVQDLDATSNPSAYQFATQVGDWTRSRYDAIYTRAGGLFRMRGDGRFVRALSRSRGVLEPCISRDGTRIAWIRDYDLVLADGNADNLEQLTRTPDRERHPSLSPDGTKIVYSVLGGASYTENQLFLLDLDTRLTTNLSKKIGPGVEPTFGRDGKSILYMNEGNIFRATFDPLVKTQISRVRTRGGAEQTDLHGPIESPDGRWIAVTRVHGDLENNWYRYDPATKHWGYRTISVWVMRSDGTGFRELAPPRKGTVEYSVFDIAPTGIWVACGRAEPTWKGVKDTLWEFDILTGQCRQYLNDEFFADLSFTGWLR